MREVELWTPQGMVPFDGAHASALVAEQLESRSPQLMTIDGPRTMSVARMGYDAARAYAQAFDANLYVYRCVQAICRSTTRIPFLVGDPDRNGIPQGHVPDDPLAQLLSPPPKGPNPMLTARQWWGNYFAQRLVIGKAASELETKGTGTERRVIGLWPLRSSALSPVFAEGRSARYFDRFDYKPGGGEIHYAPDQVFYSWVPHPDDVRNPTSVLQAAGVDVDVAVMLSTYEKAFLRNDARPATAVVHKAFATADQERAFRARWKAKHQGPDQAGSTAFLEHDGKGPATDALHVEVIGATAKDSQLVEQANAKRRDITVAFGVPLSRLGDAAERTFANASEEAAMYDEETIEPLLRDAEDDVNLRLAPLLTRRLGWFDLEQLPSRKAATERRNASMVVDAAAKEAVEEAQAKPAPEPVEEEEDAERSAQPPTPPAPPQPPAPPTPAPSPPQHPIRVPRPVVEAAERGLAAGTDCPDVLRKLARALSSGTVTQAVAEAVARYHARNPNPGRHADLAGGTPGRTWAAAYAPAAEVRTPTPAERRAAAWSRIDASATAIERTWEQAMAHLFQRQEAAVLSRLTGKRGRQWQRDARADVPIDVSLLFDAAFWQNATRDEVQALYAAAVASGTIRVAEAFGAAFDLDAPWVVEIISERALNLSGHVTQTTLDAIRGTLTEGVAKGEGIDDLAKRIRSVFADASTRRAKLIARTEVIGSSNQGASRYARELGNGIVAGKEWLTSLDGRERATHRDADGQVVTLEGSFAVGSAMMDHPGDQGAPVRELANCRCAVGFLTPEEMEERRTPRLARVIDLGTARALLAVWDPATDPGAQRFTAHVQNVSREQPA